MISTRPAATNQYRIQQGRYKTRSAKVSYILIAAVILLILAFTIFTVANSCSKQTKSATLAVQSQAAMDVVDSQVPSKPLFDASQVDRGVFEDLIGSARTDQLIEMASSNEDAAWILLNPDTFDEIGPTAFYRLLMLCTNDPNALSFVRGCPEHWGDAPTGSCEPFTQGTVPLLLQWDQRWGYAPYSLFVMGLSACGPTSICMVYQGLTGDHSKSPYDIAQDAVANDYVHSGTDSGFYYFEARKLGLTCEDLGVTAGNLRSALESGSLVIINVGPGDFTEVGHFIVATGIEGDQLTINDPFSTVRSARKWDIEQVIGQTKALYCFSK